MDDVLWGNSHRAGQFTECDLFWKRLGFRWRRMKEYWSNWERSAIVLQPARRRKMLHSSLKGIIRKEGRKCVGEGSNLKQN